MSISVLIKIQIQVCVRVCVFVRTHVSISRCLHMSSAVCVGVHVCGGGMENPAEAPGISCKFF